MMPHFHFLKITDNEFNALQNVPLIKSAFLSRPLKQLRYKRDIDALAKYTQTHTHADTHKSISFSNSDEQSIVYRLMTD